MYRQADRHKHTEIHKNNINTQEQLGVQTNLYYLIQLFTVPGWVNFRQLPNDIIVQSHKSEMQNG